MVTKYFVMERQASGVYIAICAPFRTLNDAKKWSKKMGIKGTIEKVVGGLFDHETVACWDIETLQRLPL